MYPPSTVKRKIWVPGIYFTCVLLLLFSFVIFGSLTPWTTTVFGPWIPQYTWMSYTSITWDPPALPTAQPGAISPCPRDATGVLGSGPVSWKDLGRWPLDPCCTLVFSSASGTNLCLQPDLQNPKTASALIMFEGFEEPHYQYPALATMSRSCGTVLTGDVAIHGIRDTSVKARGVEKGWREQLSSRELEDQHSHVVKPNF